MRNKNICVTCATLSTQNSSNILSIHFLSKLFLDNTEKKKEKKSNCSCFILSADYCSCRDLTTLTPEDSPSFRWITYGLNVNVCYLYSNECLQEAQAIIHYGMASLFKSFNIIGSSRKSLSFSNLLSLFTFPFLATQNVPNRMRWLLIGFLCSIYFVANARKWQERPRMKAIRLFLFSFHLPLPSPMPFSLSLSWSKAIVDSYSFYFSYRVYSEMFQSFEKWIYSAPI